jgi:Putative zinc-finger
MTPHEPDLNVLAALVEGTLSDEERSATIAHVASCATCRAVVAGLGRGLEPAGRPRLPMWVFSMAATVALAVIGGGLYWAGQRAGSPGPAAPVAMPVPPAAAPQPAPAGAPDDTTRSASVRHLGGKTFRLVAGEWIDTAYDPAALLPVVALNSPEDLKSALAAEPALQPFLALGPRFTVVVQGTVYRRGTGSFSTESS